jgi:hypothetical protein
MEPYDASHLRHMDASTNPPVSHNEGLRRTAAVDPTPPYAAVPLDGTGRLDLAPWVR